MFEITKIKFSGGSADVEESPADSENAAPMQIDSYSDSNITPEPSDGNTANTVERANHGFFSFTTSDSRLIPFLLKACWGGKQFTSFSCTIKSPKYKLSINAEEIVIVNVSVVAGEGASTSTHLELRYATITYEYKPS